MEQHKYYTPSLDEFCEGFEYETVWCEDEDDWQKCTIGVEYSLDDFKSIYIGDAYEFEFRVKYLDKDDIEGDVWDEGVIYGMGQHFFSKNPMNKYLLIFWPNKLMVEINDVSGKSWVQLHKGFIQNKSELSRIMRMVGITR